MDIDGGATIRCRPVLVELGGREYRIAAQPAAAWMLAALEGDWIDVVPGMLGDPDEVYDLMEAGRVTAADCERAAQDALGAAAGVVWWVAVRLLHVATADAACAGELRLRGVDPEVVPLGAVVAAVYRVLTRDADRKEIAKLDRELAKPPPGVGVEAAYDEDAAADAFERAYAARGGGTA